MKIVLVMCLVGFSVLVGAESDETVYVMDQRFVSLDIQKMVRTEYPEFNDKAESISHYSGYYGINPFLLTVLFQGYNDSVAALAKNIDSVLRSPPRNTSIISAMTAWPSLQIREEAVLNTIDRLMKKYRIVNQVKKRGDIATMPLLDLPFDHASSWHFNGVHTWTGDDDGQPMSSIDMTRTWSTRWGDNTDDDWVAAAHGGIVSLFSSCFMRITHPSGWATDYYHLSNVVPIHGAEVNAGDLIANNADNIEQALCQGGSSTGPHLHFSLLKNGERQALDGVELSGWRIKAGDFSYDNNSTRMWIEKDGLRRFAFSHDLAHESGTNEIDYRYSGVYSSPQINGHGVNLTITEIVNDNGNRNVLFVAFYTYDDNGAANFYVGNVDFDAWRSDESLSLEMFLTTGGNFSNLQPINFPDDVSPAGTMTFQFNNCSEVDISFSLLEPVNQIAIERQLILTQSVGVPKHVCQAPSIPSP